MICKSTPRGGRRPGSGRPKGSKSEATLTKELAREHVRQRVIAELDSLIDAQIAQAKGLSYLVVRDKKTGKFLRVSEGIAKEKAKLEDNEEIIEVWEKDPSIAAFSDLMNRALDKPKEQEQAVHLAGDWDRLAARLASARKRIARS